MKLEKILFVFMILVIAFSITSVSANTSFDNSDLAVSVEGNGLYSDLNDLSIYTVSDNTKEDVNLVSHDISLYYKNGTRLEASLLDSNNNPLVNKTIGFEINDITYYKNTNENGSASLAINLNDGVYSFRVFFNGDSTYNNASKKVTVTVLSVINGNDLIKFYKNDSQYYATFLDGQGNPLANRDVTFNIVGVFYTRTTNEDGVAKLSINLSPNEYIITCIHPDNGFMSSNKITVLPVIEGSDLTKGFKDNQQFYATFLDGQGNPLANRDVTFNIVGVFYTRTTNEDGVAKLSINLSPNEYVITCIHPDNGFMSSNVVKVLKGLSTYETINGTSFVKGVDGNIVFTLYDSLNHTLPDKKVTISINKQSYTVNTDSNGQVFLLVDYDVGTYNGKIIFDGDSYYKSSSKDFSIEVYKPIQVNFTVLSDRTLFKDDEFKVKVQDENGNILKGKNVVFLIDDMVIKANTDNEGIAKFNINLPNGIYILEYYVDSKGYSSDSDFYELTVFNSTDTEISTEMNYIIKGKTFDVYLSSGGVPLVNQPVEITVVGVKYIRYTNELGIAKLNINLNEGTYSIKYEFTGDSKFSGSVGDTVIKVVSPTKTSLKIVSPKEFNYGEHNYFVVQLTDNYGNPIESQKITFLIGDEIKVATTDSDGFAGFELPALVGTYNIFYEFEGTPEYLSSSDYVSVSIKDNDQRLDSGYYVFGRDMYNVDLETLSKQGVNNIFLNYYAFDTHGMNKVSEWISKAHSYGIKVHIWMQVYYEGSFISPLTSSGEIKYDFIYEKCNEAVGYLSSGADGISLDYLRFPGTAYKYSNGVDAITQCAALITAAVKEANPNVIVSVAVMPETTADTYYYGQDISSLSKFVDVILPMVYKGNYKAGDSWLSSTINWFKSTSQGAEIWAVLQSYRSDSDTTLLPASELSKDAQTVVDAGASGVFVFRYGITNLINFNDIVYHKEVKPVSDVKVSINDVLKASASLKSFIESKGILPSNITVGSYEVTVYQFLYLMSKATNLINEKSSSDIEIIPVEKCVAESGDVIYDFMEKEEYLKVANSLSSYILENNIAPAYASSSLGKVKFSSLMYEYSRVLNYYLNEGALPYIVYITNFLDNYSLTVTMMPSSVDALKEYQYIKYTTTWLNYCPKCGYYGTLLINPKHTHEGELTCSQCDSDFCGVTGMDKYPRKIYLTRLSDSVPAGDDTSKDALTLAGILDAALRVKNFIDTDGQLPNYVKIDGANYKCQEVLYLFSQAIVNINKGITTDIPLISVDEPSLPIGDAMESTLSKDQYMDLFNRVANFIKNNNQAPNYASSDLGKISYDELFDSSSRVLAYYQINKQLPGTVKIITFGGSSLKIKDLTASLIKGLSSDRDKALALYNYVRDSIGYSFYYNTQKGASGTLASGTGNCCDQAQLLVAMFREAGLTCRFVHGTCTFSDADYGHVWTQVFINGQWVVADPTSTRNSLGVINNWNTQTAIIHGTYDVLPF